jgi:CheY-like chemotaxis protein
MSSGSNISSAAKPLCVLVVDDHDDTAALLQRVLTRRGHRVLIADGFTSALAVAQGIGFDLLVTDLQLSDGDGWTLFAKLRERHPDLVGVAVSGHAFPADVERSRAAGFCAHLNKPIDLQELFNTVETCVADEQNAA